MLERQAAGQENPWIFHFKSTPMTDFKPPFTHEDSFTEMTISKLKLRNKEVTYKHLRDLKYHLSHIYHYYLWGPEGSTPRPTDRIHFAAAAKTYAGRKDNDFVAKLSHHLATHHPKLDCSTVRWPSSLSVWLGWW